MVLGGYGFAFRYSPGGRHTAYVEGSRSPHEGDLEFISMDLHKGCGKKLEKGFRTMETFCHTDSRWPDAGVTLGKGAMMDSEPWIAALRIGIVGQRSNTKESGQLGPRMVQIQNPV